MNNNRYYKKNDIMKVKDFALKYNFSNNDKQIVEKLHSGEEKSEQEWINLFNGKINFNPEIYKEKIESIKKEKIESIKKGNKDSNLKK